jgi:plasmid stabilization system protein ParE
MKYTVIALRRADDDVRHIARWLAERSVQGAEAWLDAYAQLLCQLADHADSLRRHWKIPIAVFRYDRHCSRHATATTIGRFSRSLRTKSEFCAFAGPGNLR